MDKEQEIRAAAIQAASTALVAFAPKATEGEKRKQELIKFSDMIIDFADRLRPYIEKEPR